MAQRLKRLPEMWETWVRSLGQGDLLEKEMATHSSILAWRIPWMEEPGRLQSMGSQSQTRFHSPSLKRLLKLFVGDIKCPSFLPWALTPATMSH